MKTSELTGLALTWVLLRLEHPDEYFCVIFNEGKKEIWADNDVGTSHPTLDREGNPRFIRAFDGRWVSLFGNPVEALNWGFCGPIIEREIIELNYTNQAEWRAQCWTVVATAYGPTPLIAAMRCYCCAKLGNEIEIPQELQPCQPPNL